MLAQPIVNPFLNDMQRQIDARLRGRDAIEGNHDEIEYQNFEQEVINQWRLRLCKEVEQVIIEHAGPALSSALSCSMSLAKEAGKGGEVKRRSVNSGICSKEEINKVLQDPIKVNLVRQLKSRLDQLQKQNLNPPGFISEPALSQINTLHKYIGN